ncbi:type B DNA-directed DNA polymerase [Haladaptatus sp. DJG-WS-42]|uniref:type B DNA-directed DNA polymerase n=1 Tax=Haladaptatus sp. DJG-WS-42 TaxID=3120516 RepID=UPI0030D604C2
MTFTIDFLGDEVVEWRKTPDAVAATRVTEYHPRIYVAGPTDARDWLEARLRTDPKVAHLCTKQWRLDLRSATPDSVLRVDIERIDDVQPLACELRHTHERGRFAPGTFRLFNVDFAPQFRYCLEEDVDPTPAHPLSTFSIRLSEKALADGDLSHIIIDGEDVKGAESAVLQALSHRLDRADPDVLVVSNGDVIPLLGRKAEEHDVSLSLGRLPGWSQLAGENTYQSYGQVGFSAARYTVPGRVVLDTSNSFLWSKSSLDGLLDLVHRSWRPLQETGWGSIGTILTSIQIREALSRGVLIPWNKWDPEQFKDVRTLHAADRGGFIFEPRVGLHENVYEVDFASLYPTIICRHNISPETVCCPCDREHAVVPELGYELCDRPGFLPEVLQPILDDRAEFKARLAQNPSEDERASLEARSSALKWILVTCFGYQGYRNAKFGRIECHEALNAYARDILLRSKVHLERAGWNIVHGIVDSLWVTARDPAPTPIEEVAQTVSDDIGIRLEFENHYDWVCFVPRRGAPGGALTKYFGKIADEDAFKIRGIEARQRSTPAFVREVQSDLLDTLDSHRDAAAVCDRLRQHLRVLRQGDVDPKSLVIRKRVSKPLAGYSQRTHTVSALQRYANHGMARNPGQDVRYVVVNDGARSAERVRLHFEECDSYDADYYETLLIRATESVVSPLGWNRERIRRYLRGDRQLGLSAFD